MRKITWLIIIYFLYPVVGNTQALSLTDKTKLQTQSIKDSGLAARFEFEGEIKNVVGISDEAVIEGKVAFVKGLKGQALCIRPNDGFTSVSLNKLLLDGTKDFSIQYWIKTTSKKPTVFISHKNFTSKGMAAQKNAGWVLYSSGGTFAWNIGSGTRRINYERDNGEKMPINDAAIHQFF